jgi:hypothetical protein
MKYHLKDLFKALCVALIMNRVRIVNAFHYPKYKYHGMSFSLHSARDIDLEKGLINARQNIDRGESPGAGLPTAYEQSDAAYADLILTSVVQKVIFNRNKLNKSFMKSNNSCTILFRSIKNTILPITIKNMKLSSVL